MAYHSVIVGCGSYLPERVVTNQELAESVDTTDEWIIERTGIRRRHIAAEGETTCDLAYAAACAALRNADLQADALDLIILATATPDNTFPATATEVQARLGLTHGAAFDVHAVCSGFLYALAVADNFLRAGQARTALVIGAETFSRILDWKDRTTCVLFGDGAGAVILRREDGPSDVSKQGVISTHLHSDGRYKDHLYVDGGPSSTQSTGYLRMAGKEVFRHAVTNLASVVQEALAANHVTAADIDWVVPHQANQRILDATARKLHLDPARVISTVDHHANTSAASVPLALTEAVQDGRIRRGQLLILEAMGGGFTWGASLVRW
ncbi:MAG: ketoacyl-ACP synthase III [Alphaproteobacteria bacterium]|nr:ketoacyl-ACP synthase III [Alphaproteobacteria bacterium]MCB9928842.1 ketoacyl-ACP synthase III [Alphaproteobacteria bacterium]